MDAMASQEAAYHEEPEYPLECHICGTQLRNGYCPDCDALEYEHEVD